MHRCEEKKLYLWDSYVYKSEVQKTIAHELLKQQSMRETAESSRSIKRMKTNITTIFQNGKQEDSKTTYQLASKLDV